MFYIKWFVFCALLCMHIECRPKSESCDADCQFAKEKRMHFGGTTKTQNLKISSQSVNDIYDQTSSTYWNIRAQYKLREHLAKKVNNNVAKNVIFFMGDGMSISTISAARIYYGQSRGRSGEESHLSFEKFPHVGLSKTYCVDRQVPDSACTATAYLCGVKANFLTIGVNARVAFDDCKAANNESNHVTSMLALAQQAGKATGIVTTTTVTHASPSGNYAHTSNRMHQSDADVRRSESDPIHCRDIASQLVFDEPGRNINVILGGGYKKFKPKKSHGDREDKIDLIEAWKDSHPKRREFIRNRKQLLGLDIKNTDYVLGLFTKRHMDFHIEADPKKQPTLREMTETAIKILQKNKNGFFLFVEGGRIDHGHHASTAIKALDETVQFSEAIERAVDMTDRDDTLIVVTSDHSHTMSIGGYPDRGNPITGLNTYFSNIDNMTSTTLSYANGPGYFTDKNEDLSRKNLTGISIDANFKYPGNYPNEDETHGGDDVAVFALGCMSHLFSGVYEENVIPHIVRYASCLGNGLTACNRYG